MDDSDKGQHTILVVEDDLAMREWLVEAVEEAGYSAVSAGGGREALRKIRSAPVDLVVTDLRMPDLDGLDLMREIRTLHEPPDVVLITAFGTISNAIKAMKLGAFDYIPKPFESDQLLLSIGRALRDRALRHEVARLRQEVSQRYHFDNIIGRSAAMREVFDLIRRVASSPVSVLVTGESGTGKELVARALHFNSTRKNAPFVAVNCAAIPEQLLESELFGYKRGAFTDAHTDRKGLLVEAEGGTLFLDEVAELTPPLQAKLLRVLQEREVKPLGSVKSIAVDIRVVSATNRDLEEARQSGGFREDLFYRLNVVQIDIPPLHTRKEDILPLAAHLLRRAAERAGKEVSGLTSQAAKVLLSYSWPGNVRELENIMERAVTLCQHTQVELSDLPPHLVNERPSDILGGAVQSRMTLGELEREYILRVLDEESGNKSQTARRLGLDRKTLYRKLEEYRRG